MAWCNCLWHKQPAGTFFFNVGKRQVWEGKLQTDDAKLNLKVYNTLSHVPKSYFEDMSSTESIKLVKQMQLSGGILFLETDHVFFIIIIIEEAGIQFLIVCFLKADYH